MVRRAEHHLDRVPISGDKIGEAREYLRALPQGTLPMVDELVRGTHSQTRESIGTQAVYAKMSPYVGNGGLALVLVNPHLGESLESLDGIDNVLNVPEGATGIKFYGSKMPPSAGGYVAGLEFRFNGREYAFLIEYSGRQLEMAQEIRST